MPIDYLARALGVQSAQEFETSCLHDALETLHNDANVHFIGQTTASSTTPAESTPESSTPIAHPLGTSSIAIDPFEGRHILSGGADAYVRLWDLDAPELNDGARPIVSRYTPVASYGGDATTTRRYGMTCVSFYPFDGDAFLTSGYDHSVKIYAMAAFTPSASFDMGSVVYAHAMSPIAGHLLTACATRQSAVRLVDLKSGVNTHALVGHRGAVLSVAWSPKDDHVLASGGVDGVVRLWDVRRSSASLGVLDHEDSIGIGGEDGIGGHARDKMHGKGHTGPCNGVVWSPDGRILVTAGHDERVRVWDVDVGANLLSHFGPMLKNTALAPLLPLLVPPNLTDVDQSIMMYPNEKEVLMFDLIKGTLIRKLRFSTPRASKGMLSGHSQLKGRVTSMAWRKHHVEMYSAHSDGSIRAWKPKSSTRDESDGDGAESTSAATTARNLKRKALNDMFRDLTERPITFT